MKRLISRAVLPGLIALALTGGCTIIDATIDTATPDGPTFRDQYGWTEERMVGHGWLQARKYKPPAIYCYRTISASECYQVQQEGEEGRLIGFLPGPNS